MRCPQCNDPDYGNYTVIDPNTKGWYVGFNPAVRAVNICQKCGYRGDAVLEDALPNNSTVWEAHWTPGNEDSFQQKVYRNDIKFEYKPREGWMGGYGSPFLHSVGFDMSLKLTEEQMEKIRKLIGKE